MRWYALAVFVCLSTYFLAQTGRARSRFAARRNISRHLESGPGGPRGLWRLAGVAGARLDRVSSAGQVREFLSRSGLGLSWNGFKCLWVSAILVLPLLAIVLTGTTLAAPPVFACALAAPRLALVHLRGMSRARARAQCDRLSSDLALYLRCGIPLDEAAALCAEDMEPPLSDALGRVQAELALGVRADHALLALAAPLDCPDLELIARAAAASRETGSDIRTIMDNVGEAVRERSAIRRELETQTVQSRMSGRVVAALPFLFLGLSSVVSRGTPRVLLCTVPGLVMLGTAVVLDVLGFLWLRKIMDIRSL